MVGLLVSFWNGLCSGAMLVSGSVFFRIIFPLRMAGWSLNIDFEKKIGMILNIRTNYTIADYRHSTFEMEQVFRDGWWQAGWWWRLSRFWRELCMEGIAIVVHADRRCHLDLDWYTPQNWHGTQKSMYSRWTRFSKGWLFCYLLYGSMTVIWWV